jgi:hypothetical protein
LVFGPLFFFFGNLITWAPPPQPHPPQTYQQTLSIEFQDPRRNRYEYPPYGDMSMYFLQGYSDTESNQGSTDWLDQRPRHVVLR